MKQALTAKLKLTCTPAEAEALRSIGLPYREAANFASKKAFDLGKTTNANLLHKTVYRDIRPLFNLPSQIACSVSRYVTAAYKTLWSKAAANKKARAKGLTKRVFKGLDKAPRFRERTVPYQYHYDYAFKPNQQVSVMTLEGRILLSYAGWKQHVALIQNSTTHIGAAKLYYDRIKKTYYLLVSLEIEVPDPQPSDHKNVIGVDVGQRFLTVTTDTKNNTHFVSGKQAMHKARQNQKTRRSLQTKQKAKKKQRLGTRSVTRRLISVSRRERRHKQSLNHSTAKRVVKRFPKSLIGLEDLTDVRERTNRRHSKKASKKQRRANRNQAKWAFAETQAFIGYKAILNGSMTIKVEAHYTSQMCPCCGHTRKANRPGKGLLFICQNCGFTLHADLIGSRNITMRTLLMRQDWMSTGYLSTSPSRKGDASDDEAKAERLQRYSELRWSPEVKVEALF
jgi:putative transposase